MVRIRPEQYREHDLKADFQDREWGAAQLQGIGIFANFIKEELEELYDLGEIKLFQPASHLIIENEMTRGLFILLQGVVSVFKNDPLSKKMIKLSELEEGAAFGELSLFEAAPRSATVAAESVCFVFHLDAKNFVDYLEQHGPDFKARFYKSCAEEMAARFRQQNNEYIHAQKLLWQHALQLTPTEHGE